MENVPKSGPGVHRFGHNKEEKQKGKKKENPLRIIFKLRNFQIWGRKRAVLLFS
jgi:hypothetical protein